MPDLARAPRGYDDNLNQAQDQVAIYAAAIQQAAVARTQEDPLVA